MAQSDKSGERSESRNIRLQLEYGRLNMSTYSQSGQPALGFHRGHWNNTHIIMFQSTLDNNYPATGGEPTTTSISMPEPQTQTRIRNFIRPRLAICGLLHCNDGTCHHKRSQPSLLCGFSIMIG